MLDAERFAIELGKPRPQVLGWFADCSDLLPVCRIKNKFSLPPEDIVDG